MTDNERYAILFPIIAAGLTARNITGVTLGQSLQPTQQGTPRGRSAFLSQLPAVPRGHVRRDSVYSLITGLMVDTELQTWEVTYQVNALAIQDPADISSLTPGDIVRAIHQIMQSSRTIAILRANGIGILRVNEVRNPAFVDDKGRNEFSPNFDFTIFYDELHVDDANIVESVELNITRV